MKDNKGHREVKSVDNLEKDTSRQRFSGVEKLNPKQNHY